MQPWLTLDELSAAFLLYHTVSWLLFFEDRARALASGRPPRPRVCAVACSRSSGFRLLLNAALYSGCLRSHVYVAAPALYFFWSALHAIHTAWVRGLEPRPAPA